MRQHAKRRAPGARMQGASNLPRCVRYPSAESLGAKARGIVRSAGWLKRLMKNSRRRCEKLASGAGVGYVERLSGPTEVGPFETFLNHIVFQRCVKPYPSPKQKPSNALE